MNSTELYRKLLLEAQSRKLTLNSDMLRKLTKIYERSLDDVVRKASTARGGFTKAWLNDYEKYLKSKIKDLNHQVLMLTSGCIETSSQLAASVYGDFFHDIIKDYKLDIPKELLGFAYNSNDKVMLNIINGDLYKDHRSLSKRIWGYGQRNIEDIQYIINQGMLSDKTQLEIIKDLEKYVNPSAKKSFNWKRVYPNVRKNVDYNAQRLLRTSINHAFYFTNIQNYKDNPYVDAVHWELSSQHYIRQVKDFGEDVCDEYANQNRYGLGTGNFPKDEVPIPHPSCMCYQSAVITKSLDEIADGLKKWVHDNNRGSSNIGNVENLHNLNKKDGKFKSNTDHKNGILKERSIAQRYMANGNRRSYLTPLSDTDKAHILNEIHLINADETVFSFRDGRGSGYSDERDTIYVSSNIYPSNDESTHPRDRMSERAALAHEYYGHRAFRNTKVEIGSWNDEFRASYMAAKNCPNLTNEDRAYLILDAIERANEAGVNIRYNDFMRRILYG